MQVVQIDIIGSQSPQTAFSGLTTVLSRGINRQRGDIVTDNTELGGQEDVGATLWMQLEPLANEVLGVAINIGGVPICAADFPRSIEDFEPVLIRPAEV